MAKAVITAVKRLRQENGHEHDEAPFRSYALDRSGSPRFHVRRVENTQKYDPAHKHDDFQILYFQSDAPILRIGLASHKPRAGSLYFIAPMVPHQTRFDHTTRCVVLYFDLDFLRPDINRSYPLAEVIRMAPELMPFAWQNHIGCDLDDAGAMRVERSISAMIEQHQAERICSAEIVRAELSLMLSTFCQDHEAEFAELSSRLPVLGRDSANMRRIADFIGENYTRGPSLDEAARAACLSKSRLCALIRQYTGTSFNVLVREMRIEDARERLVLTADSIGQIAYSVGYNDEKYFLRAFKNSVGMTPTAYRSKRTKETIAGKADPLAPAPQAKAGIR